MRVAAAVAAVLGAVAAVLLLHGPVSTRADDYAWAVALAHDKWWWGMAANLVSDATPSLGGGAALLAFGAVLSVRSRRWTPLVMTVVALVLLGAVVAGGKLLLYQGGVAGDRGYRIPGPRWPSGPATAAVVVGGTALLLLRGRVRRLGGFVVFVVAVVALNGAAEVFLGQHRLGDVVASWAAGLAIVAVTALAAGPRLRALPDGPFLPALADLLAGTPLAQPLDRVRAWVRGPSREDDLRVTVELLYTPDCPNAAAYLPRLRELVAATGITEPVRVRLVADPDEARRERFLGSPTVRVDGRDVDPSADGRRDYGLSCRLYAVDGGLRGTPPDEWVLSLLRRSRAD